MSDQPFTGLPVEESEQDESTPARPAAIVIRRLEKKETTTVSNSVGN